MPEAVTYAPNPAIDSLRGPNQETDTFGLATARLSHCVRPGFRRGFGLDTSPTRSLGAWVNRSASFKNIGEWEPHRQARTALSGVALFVAFVAHVLRRPGAISRPLLFAEDAPVFFLGNLRTGWQGINDAYNGYLIVGTRTMAFVASRFPYAWTPRLYALLTAVVTVGCCGIVLGQRCAWAFGGWWLRVAVLFALIFLPQITESHLTLTNATWWAGVGLLLIGIADDPSSWWGCVLEAVFVIVVVLTGPIGIVLSPIVAWRYWRTRSKWVLALGAMWATAALVQLAILRGQHRKVEAVDWSPELAGVMVRRWSGPFTAGSAYVQTRLNASAGPGAPGWSRSAWLGAVALLVAVAVLAWRGRDRGLGFMMLFFGALQIAAGFVALGPLARLLPDRYALGACAGLVLAVAAARPADWWARLLQAAVVVLVLMSWPRNVPVPDRVGPSFRDAAECLERSGTTCDVPAIPPPFSIRVLPTDR